MADDPTVPSRVPLHQSAQPSYGSVPDPSYTNDAVENSALGCGLPTVPVDEMIDPQTPSAVSVSTSVEETPFSKMLAQDRTSVRSANLLSPTAPKRFEMARSVRNRGGQVSFTFMPANLKGVPTAPIREIPREGRCTIEASTHHKGFFETRGHDHVVSKPLPSERSSYNKPVVPDCDLGETPRESNDCKKSKRDSGEAGSEVVSAAVSHAQVEQRSEIDPECQASQDDDVQPDQVQGSAVNKMDTASTLGTGLLRNASDNEQLQSDDDQAADVASCQQEVTPLMSLEGYAPVEAAHDGDIGILSPSPASAIKHRPKAAGRTPIHSSRVHKTQTRARARHAQFYGRLAHVETNMQQPSEEDLLYILMSRARETATAMDRLAYLEEQNKDLAREKEIIARTLEEAMIAKNKSTRQQEVLTQALDRFREKYHKLKKWALEANKDCEMLQTKALSFKASLTDLIKDRDEVVAELRDSHSASGEMSRKMKHIRSEISNLSTVAQTTISTVDRMDGLLLAQAEHLRSEKQKCRKLETHIVLMEHERHKHDSRLQCQTKEVNETLRGMTSKLEALEARKVDEGVEQGQLMTCQTMLQTLLDRGLSTGADLGSLRQTLVSMNQLLNVQTSAASETFKSAIETLKERVQNETSVQTATLLSEVQSGFKELSQAREEIAHLHRRSEQTDGIVELLRNGKSIAESREKHLQSTTEKLIEALGTHKETARKESIVLENKISSLLTKWQSVSSQLAECKKDQEKKQEEIDSLRLQLRLQEEAQESDQLELQSAQDRMIDAQRQAEENSKDQLYWVEMEICQLQAELDHEKGRREEKDAEISRLKLAQTEAQQALKESEVDQRAALTECQQLKTRIAELEAKLASGQQTKDRLKQQNENLQAKSAEQCTALTLCHESLKNLEECHLTQQEEKNALETQLAAARDELAEMVNLKNELHQRTTAVAELESSLTNAQETAARVHELQGQNASLKDQIASLFSELEGSRKDNQEIVLARKSIQDRDNEIVQLKETSNSQSIELTSIRDVLQRKEEDIANLHQQIFTLEGAVSNASFDQQTIPAQHPRRVADRSGACFGITDNTLDQAVSTTGQQPLGSEYTANHVVLTQQLTSNTTLVPETQLEPPQDREGGGPQSTSQQSRNKEDSASELSEYTSNVSDFEQAIGDLVRKKPKSGPAQKQLQKRPQPQDMELPGHLKVPERTPSSSYGSVTDQMLLDQVTQSDSQLDNLSGLVSEADEERDHNPPNGDHIDTLPYNQKTLKSGSGPKTSRSGARTRSRDSTSFPEPTPEPGLLRDTTPAVMRERYQPNSAAKRRVEHDEEKNEKDGQARRLKRRTANLDIKPPPFSSQKSQTRDPAAAKATLSLRKSSSVVGTNAPAPGKSQRTSKPARRGSRQDKYTSRFAT